jgi:hypothetical protein
MYIVNTPADHQPTAVIPTRVALDEAAGHQPQLHPVSLSLVLWIRCDTVHIHDIYERLDPGLKFHAMVDVSPGGLDFVKKGGV